MIELEQGEFSMVKEQLVRVPINHLFALAVVEGIAAGQIWVDQKDGPRAAYIRHPYGMSLLFGETRVDSFRTSLWEYLENGNQARKGMEFLQVYPNTWAEEIEEKQFSIEKHTRVNFKFNKERFLASGNSRKDPPAGTRIIRTDQVDFSRIKGSVVPVYFWNSPEDFAENGAGCSLVIDEEIVSTAFSAFNLNNMLELGIETVPEHQGKGYAKAVCAALIDYCLDNGYEPVWACRHGNSESFHLAQKLGFEPSAYLPYFKLVAGSQEGD